MSLTHELAGGLPPALPLVLAVDDDPALLASLRRVLRRLPLELLPCQSPSAALAELERREAALIISDYLMPQMNGLEFLTVVRQRWPETRTILLTGTTDMRVAAEAVNRQLVDFFLTKPWDDPQLVGLVGRALATRGPPAVEDPGPQACDGPIRLGRYELLERIASGGMAVLWRARLRGADGFERIVAVKQMLPHLSDDPHFVRMFTDEAHILSRLSHGNIVSVIDFGQHAGSHYLVLEYMDGPDLRALLTGPDGAARELPVALACHVAWQVALGLDYAHRAVDAEGQPLRLVHRDVAPQNILLTLDGQVRLADFGIARVERKLANTAIGTVKGTLDFMSPEQLQARPVDCRADVYSLGVVLYSMLTGRRPFAGQTHQETIGLILRGKYTPPHKLRSDMDIRLSAIVQQAMRRDCDRRYPDAASLATDLDGLLTCSAERPGPRELGAWIRARLAG